MSKQIREKGQSTYRSININTEELEFSKGFTELHTESHQQILKGEDFGLNCATESVKIA
jgi:UDP-N-acetyl-2-amino-2-deoxyglucuronate dehydrogenase